MKKYKNILIIKMSALGDVMHALPCAHALRELYPDARISWLVHPQFSTFVPEPPYVDEVILFDKKAFSKMSLGGKIKEFLRMKQLLSSKKFDLVLDLQGLFKSAVMVKLTGCKECYGYNDMRELSGYVSKAIHGKNDHGHVVQQYLDVVRHFGSTVEEPIFPMPKLAEERKEMSVLLKDKFPSAKKEDLIVLVPGAGWVTKEWSEKNYIFLAQRLIEDDKKIIIAGGPSEALKGEMIAGALPKDSVLNLVARTDLKQLAALMANVGLVVGGDTGPVHIAATMGARIIALFGASSGLRAGPYGKLVTIISTTEECAPCFKRVCPLKKNCMDKISVEQVLKVARE